MSKYVFLLALLVVTAFTAIAVSLPGEVPAAGTAAPAFKLTTNEGNQASLSDFKGQWVVLYFYPKDFTSGCTLEAHNFQRDLAQYEQKNAVILGVSVQDEESHQKFCTKEGLSFKLLADTKQDVSAKYDSVMTYNDAKFSARHTFLIDPQGNVQKVWVEVKPDKHSEEVLAALTQLQGATAAK